jgi:hypothetical protein
MKYFFKDMKQLIRNIKYGIGNILYYFPTIWNDRDWDYQYINMVLHKKLSRMEKRFASDKVVIANVEKVAKEIKIARLLLERILHRNYYGNSKKSSITRKKAFHHTHYMEQQDINYLFDHMKKRIQRWWD